MAKRRKVEVRSVTGVSEVQAKKVTHEAEAQDELVEKFVDRLVEKFKLANTKEKTDRRRLYTAFQRAIKAIEAGFPDLFAKITSRLADIFESVFLRLNPDAAQDDSHSSEVSPVFSLMSPPLLRVAIDRTSEISLEDSAAEAVERYEQLLAVYPNVQGSDVLPGLLAEAHVAAGSWNLGTATTLIHRVVGCVNHPRGSLCEHILVLLELFVNHVAQPSGDDDDDTPTTMSSVVPLTVWKNVLSLSHLTSLKAKDSFEKTIRNGGRYTDFSAAALSLYIQLVCVADHTETTTTTTTAPLSLNIVALVLQLCSTDVNMVCDTILQTSWKIEHTTNTVATLELRWAILSSIVTNLTMMLKRTRQTVTVDTFVRIALVARLARCHGVSAGANKASLRACHLLPQAARCAFTLDELKIRVHQVLADDDEVKTLVAAKDTTAFARAVVAKTSDAAAELIFDGVCGFLTATDQAISSTQTSDDVAEVVPLFFLDDVGIGE